MQLPRNPALFSLDNTPLLLAGLLSLAACGGSSSGPSQAASSPRISFDVARQSLGSENGAEAPILLRVEAPSDDGLPFDVAVVVVVAACPATSLTDQRQADSRCGRCSEYLRLRTACHGVAVRCAGVGGGAGSAGWWCWLGA